MKKHPIKKDILSSGFTLIELIVVITIAILGSIGFVTLTGYFAGVRDSARLSDMNSIYGQLGLTLGVDGTLPYPDNYRTINLSGTIITYQGYAAKPVLTTIKFEKGGRDPKDDVYYTYTTDKMRKQAQLLGYFEEYDVTKLSKTTNFIPQAYAIAPTNYSDRKIGTLGRMIGTLVDSTTLVPVQQNSSGTLILTDTGTGYTMYFDNTTTGSGAGTDIKTSFLANSVASGSLGGGAIIVTPPAENTCSGTTPTGSGLSLSTLVPANTTTSWTYNSATGTTACTWTCMSPNIQSGNTCIAPPVEPILSEWGDSINTPMNYLLANRPTSQFTCDSGICPGATGVVKDTITGLYWQSVPSTTSMSWDTAKAHCAALSLGGFDDWRMPDINELASIVDYGKQDGANYWYASKFNLGANVYWSSTTNADNTTNARYLYFYYASATNDNKAFDYRVVCTR